MADVWLRGCFDWESKRLLEHYKQRTLTNLYNAHPAWLAHTHQALDAAVAATYGWADQGPEMAEEEILRRLLALNLERSEEKKVPCGFVLHTTVNFPYPIR